MLARECAKPASSLSSATCRAGSPGSWGRVIQSGSSGGMTWKPTAESLARPGARPSTRLRARGHRDVEARAAVGPTRRLDAAAQGLDDPLGEGEAEPRAAARAGGVGAP